MKYSILLLASIFLIGCNGEKKYESPTAVYEAAQVASKERNMEDLMNCLTEDSQKDIVNQVIGMLVFLGLGDLSDKDLPKPIAKMQKAMKKHGLSQTVLKELEEGTDYPIKDKAQFVGDFFNSMDIPKSKNLPAIWTDFLEPKGTLENLSIDGDTASASVVREGSKATIIFTKFGESWLIDRHKAALSLFEQLGKKDNIEINSNNIDLNGNWIGKGYSCWDNVDANGDYIEKDQEISITHKSNQVVATKITGDNCVQAGEKTWEGEISGNWIEGFIYGTQRGQLELKTYPIRIRIINENMLDASGAQLQFVRSTKDKNPE